MYYLPGMLLTQELCHAVQADLCRKQLVFKRIIVFALGRPGAVDAEYVNYAENEQICRYSRATFRDVRFLKYGSFSRANMHNLLRR